MRLGITGSGGFLGWHQRAYFKASGAGHELRLADRDTFARPEALAAFTNGLDVILHFAGMNRGDDAEVEATNIALAESLAAAGTGTKSAPFIAFANSTHCERDTAYGRGKRAAAETLRQWAKQCGAGFANVILPHMFGEFGKPFYNSAVSTFCFQLAEKETPRIITDGDLELAHAQEAAALFARLAESRTPGEHRLLGAGITVRDLLNRLSAMHRHYVVDGIFPDLASPLDIRLFNTLRSYLFPKHYPVAVALRRDARGHLFEAVKAISGGQAFLSATHPGVTRGNHFHTRKIERFLVIGGQADIRLRKLFTNDIIRFSVNGEAPAYIDIPSFYTHDITNTGASDLTTLFWSNEIFDPDNPDTTPEPVETA